jgi:Fe-S-cluster containining protein
VPSPCAECTLGCCRNYLVTVTGYDAWVIANGLHIAPEEFLVVVPQQDQNGRGFYLDRTGTTYDIALDKQKSDAEKRPCIFWLEFPGGIGRCGIYPLRPFVCQTYPAALSIDGAVVRREDVLCPDDAWRDGILQSPIWGQRVLKMLVEYNIYGLAIARWNYHVEHTPRPESISILTYYSFLMDYYSQLEPLRVETGEDEWKAMCAIWGQAALRGLGPFTMVLDELQPWSGIIEGIKTVATNLFPEDIEEAREAAAESVA